MIVLKLPIVQMQICSQTPLFKKPGWAHINERITKEINIYINTKS